MSNDREWMTRDGRPASNGKTETATADIAHRLQRVRELVRRAMAECDDEGFSFNTIVIQEINDQKPKLIEMGKKYRTRGGATVPSQAVRILCVDAPGERPVIGIIGESGGVEAWFPDGGSIKGYETWRDLVEDTGE